MDDSEKLASLFFVMMISFVLFIIYISPQPDPLILGKIAEIEKDYVNCVLVDVRMSSGGGGYKAGGGQLWGKAINDKNETVDVYMKEYSYKEALKFKGKKCSLKVNMHSFVRDNKDINIFRIKKFYE